MQSVADTPGRLPLIQGSELRGNARREALKMLRRLGRRNPEGRLHSYWFYCVVDSRRVRLSPFHSHPEVVLYTAPKGRAHVA